MGDTQMTVKTLEDAIAQNHAALDAMLNGDSTSYVALLSDRDDVTWGNPFGPFARGRESVEATLASASALMQGGRATDFDLIATYLAENLAVVVEVEHGESSGARTSCRRRPSVSPASIGWRAVPGSLFIGMPIPSQRRARVWGFRHVVHVASLSFLREGIIRAIATARGRVGDLPRRQEPMESLRSSP
jgi:hypothetical protein